MDASSPNARANSDRRSRRSRVNSRPTFPKPTRTIRRRIRFRLQISRTFPAPCRAAATTTNSASAASCTPTPVRSATVISSSEVRPGFTRRNLAELRVDVRGAEHARLDGMMDFPQADALIEAIRDDLVGFFEHPDVQLLLVRTVRADGRDVRPGRDPFGVNERLARWRHRDDDVGSAHRLFDRLRREHPNAVTLLHLLRVAARLRLGPPEGDDPLWLPHAEDRVELEARLCPDPDDPDSLDLALREEVRRERARGSRSQIREVTVVEEDRLRKARRRVEDEDDAAPGRKASARVGVRSGGDFDGEGPRPLKVGPFHMGLGPRLRDVEVDDARENRLAPRHPDERVSDRGERLRRPHQIADLPLRQEKDVHHAFPFSARSSRSSASIRSNPWVRYAGASPIPIRM